MQPLCQCNVPVQTQIKPKHFTLHFTAFEALKSHFLPMLSEKRYPKSTNFYRVCSVYASTQTTPEPWIAAWASKRQFMQQHLLYVDSNCLLL